MSFGFNIVKLEARAEPGWILLLRNTTWRTPWRVHHEEEPWPRELPLVTVVVPCSGPTVNAVDRTFSRMEIINEPHSNPAEARNIAVRRARAKWICCVRPEDRLEPTYLEKCLFRLETEGLDLCGLTAPVYRRELWNRVGYDPQIEPRDVDTDFFHRVEKSGARRADLSRPVRPDRRPGTYSNLLPSPLPSANNTILLAMPFLTIGGAEASLSRICAELSERDFRFVVVTTVPAGPEHGDSSAWFEKSTREIFHLPQFLHESRWPDFLEYLIESRGIHVLWQVGSSFTYDLLPRIRQRFANLRVLDLLFNPVGHGANFLKYNCFIDHVVAEHRGMEEWLLANGWSPEKLTVIPNGISMEQFQPAVREKNEKFAVGFFGRLSEEKAPDIFIDIAAQLRDRADIEFTIAGGGPLTEQIRQSISSRALHNVRFLGFVDATGYLSCCDVLVVCSRLDGRPNAVMEAQAMGVPVIASRAGGLPEMISDRRTGLLVDSEDAGAFARAIHELSSDPVRCKQMRQAARQWAAQQFSLHTSIDKYIALLHDLSKIGTAAASRTGS